MLRKKTLTLLIIFVSLFVIFTSCGGGGAKVEQGSQTLGQELIDLDKAYKDGIISEKQYNDSKKALIKKHK